MSDTLHKLQVIIEGNNSKLKQISRESTQETRRMTDSINKELGKVKNPMDVMAKNDGAIRRIRNYVKEAQLAAGIKVYTDDYLKLQKDISGAEKSLSKLREKMAGMDESKHFIPTEEFIDLEKNIKTSGAALDKLYEKKRNMESSGKAMVPTTDYRDVTAHLNDAQARLDNLIAKQNEWKSLGFGENGSSVMMNLKEQIQETEAEIAYLKGEMRDLEDSGQATAPTKAFKDLTYEIARTEKKLQAYKNQRDQMINNGSNTKESAQWEQVRVGIASAEAQLSGYYAKKNSMEASGQDVQFAGGLANRSFGSSAEATVNHTVSRIKEANKLIAEAIGRIPVIGRVASEAAYIGSKAFGGLRNALKSTNSETKRSGGLFASLIQRFRTGTPTVDRFRNSLNRTGNSGRGLGGMLQTIGMSARFMFASFLISGALSSASAGLQNLAQYSDSTNQSISTLQSALKQLQNSFAAAFAPVLNVVAPILDTLIGYLISAANAVSQFMAVLTGQNSYIVAKRVATDFAAGASAAGSAAGSAADSAERLKRSLMGFDQINKLEDTSSSSGGSGGGGGAAGSSAGDMFETLQVDNAFKSNVTEWLDKLKSKLEPTTAALKKLYNEGLSKLGNFVWTGAKDFYEQFLVPVGNWALGEGLPRLINATNDFLLKIDWNMLNDSLRRFWKAVAPFAKGIGEGLISFYEDLTSLGADFINTVVPGGLNALSDALEGMNAEDIEKIGYALGVIARSIAAIKVSASLISKLKSLLSLFGLGAGTTASTATAAGTAAASGGLAAKINPWISRYAPVVAGGTTVAALNVAANEYTGGPELMFESAKEKIKEFLGNEDWSKGIPELIAISKKMQEIYPGFIKNSKDETPEVEVQITGNNTEFKKIVDDSVDYSNKTLPNETYVEVDANTNPLKKTYSKLQREFKKGTNPLSAFLLAVPDGIQEQMEKIGSETLLEVPASVATKSHELQSSLQTKVSAFSLMIGAKIGTSANKLQNEATGKFLGYTAPLQAEIATTPETLVSGMQGGLAGMALHMDVTGTVNELNDGLTKEQKTINTKANFTSTGKGNLTKEQKTITAWANFTKRILGLSDGERTISTWAKYVSSQDGLSTKEKLINAVANYSSAQFGNLSWSDRLVNVIGKVTELQKKSGLSLGLSAVVSSVGNMFKAVFREDGGVYTGGSWRPVTAFASGGLPSMGQMFIAREAGPELVGTIGGHTAVMNNNQIVSSVSAGVYQAVVSAMSQFAGNHSSGTPAIYVYVGGRQVTDVVVEQVNQQTKATGVCPILT